jgi:shikimate kinase
MARWATESSQLPPLPRKSGTPPLVPLPRRIVLVGFMASGKTVVGRALARRLRWRHLDLDQEIERRAGRTVAEIFQAEGEPAFRALEVEITPVVLAQEKVVISTGGGWVTNPGLFESLPPDTLTVWLSVSPEQVVRRLSRSRGQPVRPLLRVPEPGTRIRELLTLREPSYRKAQVTIRTDDHDVPAIVDALERILHQRGSLENQAESTEDHAT